MARKRKNTTLEGYDPHDPNIAPFMELIEQDECFGKAWDISHTDCSVCSFQIACGTFYAFMKINDKAKKATVTEKFLDSYRYLDEAEQEKLYRGIRRVLDKDKAVLYGDLELLIMDKMCCKDVSLVRDFMTTFMLKHKLYADKEGHICQEN